jgi:transposase
MMEQAMAQRNRSLSLKSPKSRQALSLVHPNAAGIDIGGAAHFVAVPPDRDEEPVREFASFTADLNALADWLEACGVDTVAMESTGVYWIPLYELLDARGFTVLLVNARHVKNVSGRKSDVLDCQWLQQLMSYGLLRGAFRPADGVCALRSLSRQREMLLKSQARHVQHMQKALTQMNLQLANVISDVVGETGQRILRAIVAGERDGRVLAAMKNVRIHASTDEIAKSLQGHWRGEHLFALKQALALFDFYGTQLTECDRELEQQLHSLQVHDGEPAKGKKRSHGRNAPKFDLRTQLFKMCGVDLTRIDGIDVTTALAVVSEVGADLSRFPSDKHFASWLGVCPGTRITGGKVLSGKTKRCANRAAQALRLAAAALRTSQSALGAYPRRSQQPPTSWPG